MSRTTTRASDTDTAHADDSGDLDERAERVVDHARELEQLREEKRERLHDADRDTTRFRDLLPSLGDGDAIKTGWIRDAERQYGDYRVEVDVPDDGDTRTVTFYLDWPDDVEDANVENEVIALAHLVGDSDSLDDILEQEVPVVKKKGQYHLDLPETPSRRSRLRNWLRRRLTSGGVLEYDGDELEVNSTVVYAALLTAATPVLAAGLITLAASVAGFDTLLTGIAGTIATGFVAAVLALFATALLGDPHNEPDPGMITFGLVLTTCAVYALVADPTAHATGLENLTDAVSYAATVLGGFVLAIAGGAGVLVPTINAGVRVSDWASEKARAVGRWLKRRRGIDYLRDP